MRKVMLAALIGGAVPFFGAVSMADASACHPRAKSVYVKKPIAKVGCRRCGDCYGRRADYYPPSPVVYPPPVYSYVPYPSPYVPGVVYYGPSGPLRPYPPIVVYDYPGYSAPWYPSRRYGRWWRDDDWW
jgi:hypothetical protein